MRNTVLLLAVVAAGVVNGLWLDDVPLWRQALCLVLALLAYLDGRYLPVRRAWPVFAAVLGAGIGVASWNPDMAFGLLGMVTIFVTLPWLAGRYLWQRAELIAIDRQRIDDLEREQAHIAEGARLRERERIAADLHDALGHELALVALRAGAFELDASVPDPHRETAADLRRAAVAATDTLRQTLSLLRTETPDAAAPPDETIADLVARVRAAGMTVTLHRTGLDDALPPLAGRALHRIAQEALTNAARHAPGAPVTVHVERSTRECTLTITNPRPARDADRTEPGSGLLSLRERVRLLDGTFDAAPDADTFTVRARIPLTPGEQEAPR